jgi:hypothetical protein
MVLVELVLFLVPALLLALSLLAGRYPGENALRARISGSRRLRRPSPRPAAPRFRLDGGVRGSLLLAHSLADRAPPAAVRPA